MHNRYRSASPSGEDRVVDQEHAALVAAGHEVERFERHSDDIAGRSLLGKALVPAQVVWSRRSGVEFARTLNAFQPDVVHIHNVFPLISPSVLRVCESRHVPCVVTIHNYRLICPAGGLFRQGSICRSCVGRHVPSPALVHGCYRGSTVATAPLVAGTITSRRIWESVPSAYLFPSAAQQEEYRSLELPASRCFVMPHLVFPVEAEATRGNLVAYLGLLSEEKGLRQLMTAWDLYLESHARPHLRLAVAGTGPLEVELRAWAASRPSVTALGLLDRTRCATLVGQARAVVAPSQCLETFGLVVAEAMAAGVAPIAADHGGYASLITHGVDGFLFPPRDVHALVRLLLQVESDPGTMARVGQAARATYRRRFTPAKRIAEMERIYRFAMANPRWKDRQERPLGTADLST